MKSDVLSPRDLFGSKEHFEVPAFQRPYVWTRDDQWSPLWDDVVRIATEYAVMKDRDPESKPDVHHFLGAIVIVTKLSTPGDVTRREIIDGQQRLTTIQLLLSAVQEAVRKRSHADMAEALRELVTNDSQRFVGKNERFKIWPARADRTAFVCAMEGTATCDHSHLIFEAHQFFTHAAEQWLAGWADDDGDLPPSTESRRAEALVAALAEGLLVVSIDLTGHDDPQLIFETLNDRGAPLLKADLVKNWLFRQGEILGSNVERWADELWAEFDENWWRYEIRQGRLMRARIDVFLQYWLTMRRHEEVRINETFREFVSFATPRLVSASDADDLLTELRHDADVFRSLAELDPATPPGRFYSRVIERLELAAMTPLFLWLLSDRNSVPPDQTKIALEALESWAVRRTLLLMTTKDMNKFSLTLLRALDSEGPHLAGHTVFRLLSEQVAETRVWPSDDTMMEKLPSIRLYWNVRQDRLRLILSAIEERLRSSSQMYEAVAIPDNLELEHVMPRGWRRYWNPEPILDPVGEQRRDNLVNTIGNLTLVTRSLNASLSNRPWTDDDACGLKEGGQPGRGKRHLLDEFSLLVLNKNIVSNNVSAWTDKDIANRGEAMTKDVCMVWPGPDTQVQDAAFKAATESLSETLPVIPWSRDDINRLVAEAGDQLTVVLDTLADDPSASWSGDDFRSAGLAQHPHSALGALTVKTHTRFGRRNSPINYTFVDGTWRWSLDDSFARQWRQARSDASS